MKQKYTQTQRKEVAKHILKVKESEPKSYERFVAISAVLSNVTYEVIEHRIHKFASL